MHPLKSLQGTSLNNKVLIPHSGTTESSRKRKLIAVDREDSISPSNHEHSSPEESSLQHETGLLAERNVEGTSLELFSNERPPSTESTTFRQQSDNGKFDGRNNLSGTLNTCKVDFGKAGAKKLSNASSNVLLESVHYGGSPVSQISDGETLNASTRWPKTDDMFIHTEKHKEMPVLKISKLEGMAKLNSCFQSGMNSKSKSYLVKENRPLEGCNSLSECFKPSGLLQCGLTKRDRLTSDLSGKVSSIEASLDRTSCDLKQSGGQTSNYAGVNVNTTTVGTGSSLASTCAQPSDNDTHMQNDIQFHCGSLGLGLSDNYKNENDRDHRGGNLQTLKQVECSDVESFEHSFMEKTGPKNDDCPPTMGIRHDLSQGSLNSRKKSKSPVRKEAPTVAEKLWDGSLLLNSSVTVLAVAFFKSGERMPNIKWSESIEVKGKVRLEAFEKYVKDLPRSRNRGLMVISLCWKDGSSDTGLAGMKKVAKGYKDGERVGLAPLSPGMDLYICPRTETIITILAKHGFFKGMAAIEDNQDSLIGCVVWRRNQANSRTIVKNSERKRCSFVGQFVKSPADAPTLRVGEGNMCRTQLAEEPIPVPSGTGCATLESAGKENTETKNAKPSYVQPELHNQSTVIKPLPAPSVPSDSLSLFVEMRKSGPNHVSHQDSLVHSSEVEAPQMHNSKGRAKHILELRRPVLSLPSEVINKVASLADDDDLPEFDFGISTVITNKKLPAARPSKMNQKMPTMTQNVASPVFDQGRLENSILVKVSRGAIQKKTQLRNFVEHGKIHGSPLLEEKYTAQNTAVRTHRSHTAVPFSENPFVEDEDDMPEWCPPDVQLNKQPVRQTNQTSTTSSNSKVPLSICEASPGPTRPALPFPSLGAIYPPFSAQDSAVTLRSTQPRPASGYMQRGPIPLTRLNSNSLLRPTSNIFDVRFPIHPACWRGWQS